MPAVERKMVKHITASGGGSLVAGASESFRVTDVYCKESSHDDYLTFSNDGRVINKIRVKGKAGNHCPYPSTDVEVTGHDKIGAGLFAYLRALGFDLTIPVPTGSTLTVSRYAEVGNVCLVYDRYPAGEVKADEPNGPLCKVNRYLHYATNAGAVTASPGKVDSSLIWTGGDKWPFDGSALGNDFLVRLFGILAAPTSFGSGAANLGYTDHVLAYREGDMIFDSKDQVGIPFLGDASNTAASASYKSVGSLIGPLTENYLDAPFMLIPPLDFFGGDKLTVNVGVTGATGAGISAGLLDFCLLLEKGPKAGR
jgi:hypothetical protein